MTLPYFIIKYDFNAHVHILIHVNVRGNVHAHDYVHDDCLLTKALKNQVSFSKHFLTKTH